MSESGNNTVRSFYDKWHRNADCVFEQTLTEGSEIHDWILRRNGFSQVEEFQKWLSDRKRVLDAGCGNGRVTALLRRHAVSETEIVGIDLTASDIAADNLKHECNVCFRAMDLLGDLSPLGKFDLIYCQEVLHHTGDPRRAFANLCTLLADGGEIAIYVYKKKAPVREFSDDFVRGKISALPYGEAYHVCEQLVELGKSLSDLKLRFKAPSIPVLGIEEGEYDIQRFIYHFFLKCFWNDDLSRNDNVVINYDWYHPQSCSRHALDEVREWFDGNGLEIIHEHVDHYGITVRGVKGLTWT